MDCIFCKIAKKIIQAKIITETKNSIAFLDAFPLARGHTLVIPKNHYEKVQDMTNNDYTDLFNTVHLIPRELSDQAGPVHSMFKDRPKLSEEELDELCTKIKNM